MSWGIESIFLLQQSRTTSLRCRARNSTFQTHTHTHSTTIFQLSCAFATIYQSIILYIDVIDCNFVQKKKIKQYADLFMQSDWIESLIHNTARSRLFRVKNMSKIKLIAMKDI